MDKKIIFLVVAAILSFNFTPGMSPSFAEEKASPVPYPAKPDWQSDNQGQCGTGLEFADITGDGWKDMVISNGNDIAKQHVVVYYNNGDGTFPKTPNWKSEDYEFNGNLSVGDINRDGLLDVAVSIYLGEDHTYEGGGIKVYFNKGKEKGYLEKNPSWRQTGYPSFNNSLGDANGDGYLDLAVAAGNPIAESETYSHQEDCKYPPTDVLKPLIPGNKAKAPKTPHLAHQLIYYNHNGVLEDEARWKSSKKLAAMDTEFADLNKDGRIDVIFGSPQTMAFFGKIDGNISRKADWKSSDANHFSNQIDYAASLDISSPPDSKARVASLVISNNNYMGGGPGGLNLFRFTSPYIYEYNPKTSSPTWTTQIGGWGSGVTLADVNSDGYLDLLGVLWAPPNSGVLGAPVQIYLGDGLSFEKKASYSSQTSTVPEILAVADVDKKGLEGVTDTFGEKALNGSSVEGHRVLILSHQNVEEVNMVVVNDRILESNEYSTVPGKNLIYFSKPLKKNAEVTVAYYVSDSLDMGVTNWDCKLGDYIFYNQN